MRYRALALKIAAVSVCVCIMLIAGGCGGNADSGKITLTEATKTTAPELGSGEIYVYFSASDSLNPYEAQTLGNRQLASLMFDPLARLDAELNPELKIAKSIEIDGRDVTVTLKDVVFSDGSALTAEDVIYSLSQAKNADNKVYAEQLSVITGYSEQSSDTVALRLSRNDPLIANVLDFPIIKKGSTNRKNDDDKELPPIGCGRYVYSDDSGEYTLSGNKKYYGKIPENKITLDNTPDKDALQYSVKAGEVDIYYSGVMTGELLSMSGKSSLVKQTNIVFLGMNYGGALKNKYIRCAISSLIGRRDICSSAYFNYSEPAKSLYWSGMDITADLEDIFKDIADEKTGAQYLKSAGYSALDSGGYYVNSDKSRIELTLLYNGDNTYQNNAAELIAKQLKNQGISVTLDKRGYQNYLNAVLQRDYDMYLGEIKLNKDFDYTNLFSGNVVADSTLAKTGTTAAPTTTTEPRPVMTDEDGDTVYGDDGLPVYMELTGSSVNTTQKTTINEAEQNEDMPSIYSKYLSGKLSVNEFLGQFYNEMPFVPIAFRYGSVTYNSNISPAAVSTISDAYYNIEYLTIKK